MAERDQVSGARDTAAQGRQADALAPGTPIAGKMSQPAGTYWKARDRAWYPGSVQLCIRRVRRGTGIPVGKRLP